MPTMKQRRGTRSQWVSADPVLAAGEIGVELGTGTNTGIDRFKIGNGLSKWSELKYFLGEAEINLDFGRLSEEALDSRYVQGDLVETGRLSEAALDESYAPVALVDTVGQKADAQATADALTTKAPASGSGSPAAALTTATGRALTFAAFYRIR